MGVVADAVGLDRKSLVVDHQLLRAGVAEVHPQRARARPAVEGDEERPAAGVGDVGALVVGVVEGSDGDAVLAIDRLRSRGHAIRHPFAADGHLGGPGDGHVGRQLALGQLTLLVVRLLLLFGLVGLLCGAGRGKERRGESDPSRSEPYSTVERLRHERFSV
jgi:hypothetical protein